ncbi:MAG: pimeloyl-ACP methyl ester carboxylesterase [Myxococcota bacterium]|jgi:pimeloyl-ACP methyl ester carboxylesterase
MQRLSPVRWMLACVMTATLVACAEREARHDRAVNEVVAQGWDAQPLQRPQTPSGDFPYRIESYTWGDPILAGTLTLPGGDGPFPAVLLITGSGPQDRDETIFEHKPFWVIADHLTRRGIGVLRVDDRGVGQSGGDVSKITLQTNADDVRTSLAWLRARPDVDPSRVGLIGHSEGGILAAMVAADNPDVSFIVSLAGPGVPGDAIIMDQFDAMMALQDTYDEATQQVARKGQRTVLSSAMKGASKEQLRRDITALLLSLSPNGADPFTVEAQTHAVASPWFRSFLVHHPAADWKRVGVPVLVLNGTLDTQVRHALNVPPIEAALRAGGNNAVTIDVRHGLNHLFQPAKTGSPMEYRMIETTFDTATLARLSSWVQNQVSAEK